MKCGGGHRGGRLGERGKGGVQEVGEEGAGSGIPKGAGSGRGEKGKNHATLHNILQLKKCKEAEANKYRAETGTKGYTGSGRFKPPVRPPPPPPPQ